MKYAAWLKAHNPDRDLLADETRGRYSDVDTFRSESSDLRLLQTSNVGAS